MFGILLVKCCVCVWFGVHRSVSALRHSHKYHRGPVTSLAFDFPFRMILPNLT